MTDINGFTQELAELINKYSLENESNTPDFILAAYLVSCLANWNCQSKAKVNWEKK